MSWMDKNSIGIVFLPKALSVFQLEQRRKWDPFIITLVGGKQVMKILEKKIHYQFTK